MPEKSRHVGQWDDPLPSPLTTRNHRPRHCATSTRALYRDASIDIYYPTARSSPPRSRGGSREIPVTYSSTNHPSIMSSQPPAEPSSSSSSSKEKSSGHGKDTGPPRAVKRRKTGRSTSSGIQSEEPSTPIDELLSDADDSLPSHSNAGPSAHQGLQIHDAEISGSPLSNASSTSVKPQDTPSSPVSSPSLAKILNATNIEIQKQLPSPSRTARIPTPSPKPPEPEPLSEYTCPICFFPPTNATLTPCGHICCGSCLFTAVRATMQRGVTMGNEGNVARCPVCRAEIPGWDSRGGGVIGLRPRVVLSL